MMDEEQAFREKARRERDAATRVILEAVEKHVTRGTRQHDIVRRDIINALELMEAHIVNYAISGSR